MPEDHYAVQRVLSTYAQLIGRGDWPAVLDLFGPDAVWEIPHLDLTLEGHEAIAEAFIGLPAQFEYVLQINAPAVIDLDGDVAHARAGMREVGKLKDGAAKDAGKAFEYLGLYDDTLVRTPQGWKFVRRVFQSVGAQVWELAAEG
jgi:ketosteroid isomerase-like protein